MAIPTALLRRFYIENSLENGDRGFRFRLINRVAPTTIVSLGPIQVDDVLLAPDEILVSASKSRPASAIREQSPFYLRMGKQIALSAPGKYLDPGEHHVALHLITKEVGPVAIEFDATVA